MVVRNRDLVSITNPADEAAAPATTTAVEDGPAPTAAPGQTLATAPETTTSETTISISLVKFPLLFSNWLWSEQKE
jgi:hypothetical protein